jgi:hypothetical protein
MRVAIESTDADRARAAADAGNAKVFLNAKRRQALPSRLNLQANPFAISFDRRRARAI